MKKTRYIYIYIYICQHRSTFQREREESIYKCEIDNLIGLQNVYIILKRQSRYQNKEK